MNSNSNQASSDAQKQSDANGPKYILDIEGTKYEWSDSVITTEQIVQLGGWDLSQGVVLIDQDNNERTLTPGEVVEIKPGQGFSKKVRFKRGSNHPLSKGKG